MTLEQLREFLGWCTVVNFGLLLVSTVAILAAGRWIARLGDGEEQPVGRLYSDQVRAIAGR